MRYARRLKIDDTFPHRHATGAEKSQYRFLLRNPHILNKCVAVVVSH